MDTLSDKVLSVYKYLEVESINSDSFVIDATSSRGSFFSVLFIIFIGGFLSYNLIIYYSLELVELIFLLLGIVGSYFVFKNKKKICLMRIKFDAVSGLVTYEDFFKKKKVFDFSEIELIKKDITRVGRVSSYKAVLFYFEAKKSKKKYMIGEIFRSQKDDFDFINFINSFMQKEDKSKLNIIPYQRKEKLGVS